MYGICISNFTSTNQYNHLTNQFSQFVCKNGTLIETYATPNIQIGDLAYLRYRGDGYDAEAILEGAPNPKDLEF